jgi:peptide/nickel transport system permease protein
VKALLAFTLVVLLAPLAAPYTTRQQFSGYQYAPPMRPHMIDEGRLHLPFAYPVKPVDPLERRFDEDRSRRLASFDQPEPWFLLGSDAFGRDVLSRLLAGARLSLGLALLATIATLALGALIGAAAAHFGGWLDSLLMRTADVVLVLPGIYVVLALRGAMPIVLSPQQVFTALLVVLSLVGWPTVARGVRGILVVERRAEYAEAARALGVSSWGLIVRHLLPATRGFLGVQATLLVPAFVMAEATLSFAGLGFAPPTPSWGVMLMDAAAPRIVADAPWLLAPAVAIVITVAVVHAVTKASDRPDGSVSSTQLI